MFFGDACSLNVIGRKVNITIYLNRIISLSRKYDRPCKQICNKSSIVGKRIANKSYLRLLPKNTLMETNIHVRVLHTTDIHLGLGFKPGDKTQLAEINEEFHLSLEGKLIELLRSNEEAIDFWVISGDLRDGKSGDYGFALATAFVSRILLESGFPADNVIVCPGNHDIVRADPRNAGNAKGFIKKPWCSTYKMDSDVDHGTRFNKYVESIQAIRSISQPSPHPRWVLEKALPANNASSSAPSELRVFRNGDKRVHFYVVNSAHLCGIRFPRSTNKIYDEYGTLLLFRGQVEKLLNAAEALQNEEACKCGLNILVMHHSRHLLQIREQYHSVHQLGAFAHLDEKVDLCLVGHVHPYHKATKEPNYLNTTFINDPWEVPTLIGGPLHLEKPKIAKPSPDPFFRVIESGIMNLDNLSNSPSFSFINHEFSRIDQQWIERQKNVKTPYHSSPPKPKNTASLTKKSKRLKKISITLINDSQEAIVKKWVSEKMPSAHPLSDVEASQLGYKQSILSPVYLCDGESNSWNRPRFVYNVDGTHLILDPVPINWMIYPEMIGELLYRTIETRPQQANVAYCPIFFDIFWQYLKHPEGAYQNSYLARYLEMQKVELEKAEKRLEKHFSSQPARRESVGYEYLYNTSKFGKPSLPLFYLENGKWISKDDFWKSKIKNDGTGVFRTMLKR
jgi:hypothetical protein